MNAVQDELFPEFHSTIDDLPDDIRQDLEVITGGYKMEEKLGLPIPKDIQTAQERFLAERAKRTEKKEIEIKGQKVLVLDLATEEGRSEYEKFMTEIVSKAASDPMGWKIMETPGQLMIDPVSPQGYRLITLIRYWQQQEVKIPGDHGFTVIPSGAPKISPQ